jgi:hypothetical protein
MRPSPSHRTIERRDAALKGFVGQSPATLLSDECQANLRPFVRDTLDDMFERVNRAAGVKRAAAARGTPAGV